MPAPLITAIRPVPLAAPLEKPVASAIGTMYVRNGMLVEVETDAGITGIGESWVNFPSWALSERVATITHGLAPLLVGERLDDPRRLWRLCQSKLHLLGLQWGAVGPVAQTLSGVDIALWDLAGKLAGAPVWQLLGAPQQDTIPAYASGLGPGAAAEQAATALASGFSAVKLKLGFGREVDERNLVRVRDAIGSATLFTDANQGWSLPEALALLPEIHAAGASWLEEPLPADDPDAWRELRTAAHGLPLAGGENLYGLSQFRRWGQQRLLDVLQPDVAKCSGISAMTEIFATGAQQGLRLAPHYFGGAVGLAASIHVFAALPPEQRVLMEYDVNANPLREDLLTEPLYAGQGKLRVPQGPGLGITLRPGVVEKLRT